MTSGGARARSGPAPDKDALRRDRDSNEWTPISPEPRIEPAPPWPLSKPFTAREKAMWAEEWQRPQARMWERLGLEREVAAYVRTVRRFESKAGRTGDGTLMRQLAEDLGISISGLQRNRWIIGTNTPAAAPAAARQATGPSAKDRLNGLGLNVVAGGEQ